MKCTQPTLPHPLGTQVSEQVEHVDVLAQPSCRAIHCQMRVPR